MTDSHSLIKKGVLTSAHDCADGGLFITLLESAMFKNLGFDVVTDSAIRKDALFVWRSTKQSCGKC